MRGDDGGTFEAALEAVRRFGGVLEHPAYSKAWSRYELPVPTRGTWVRSLLDEGWVTELDQHAYRHAARKRTWLYFVGPEPPEMDWTRAPEGLPLVSSFSYNRGAKWHAERTRVRPKEARSTPIAFRDTLIAAARTVAAAAPSPTTSTVHPPS